MSNKNNQTQNFEATIRNIRKESAEAVGVSVEELENMTLSEIKHNLRKNKRRKFIKNHTFGKLQLKIKDWLYKKRGGGRSLLLGNLYE